MSSFPHDDFLSAINSALNVSLGAVVLDGSIHRFALKPNCKDKNGWYIGYGDNLPAGSFGSWQSGETHSWCAKSDSQINPQERETNRLRFEQAAQQREIERVKVQSEAAKNAKQIWESAQDANQNHPYLVKKGIESQGLRQSRDSLVVPVRIGGELTSLQFISGDGSKKFLSGGALKGGYYSLAASNSDKSTIVICEGLATAFSVHEACGYGVAIAFNAGNLEPVAKALRAKLPNAKLIIAADNDMGEINIGLTKANEASNAVGGIVALPLFNRAAFESGTDWNDFHALHGLEATRIAFEAVIAGESAIEPKPKQVEPQATLTAIQIEIIRLSKLSPLEYDQERKSASETLGVRATTLDREVKEARETHEIKSMASMFAKVEPWHESVNGAALFDEIRQTLNKFIICEPETAIAASLWIGFTWIIDHVSVAPLAVITAPEKRCGKSQLLNLISRLVAKPLPASNITAAAMFRVIEAFQPALMIDEADTFMRDNPELVGVVNSGHTRQAAFVIRTVGEEHEPKQFSTWSAKAISGIGTLTDTIMDRSIILELRRKLPHESVSRLRHADGEIFTTLTQKLSRFALDNGANIGRARPDIPAELNDRAQDNWEALLAISDCIGGEWPAISRDAALKISGKEQENISFNAELLEDIKAAFDLDNSLKMPMALLVQRLVSDDMGAWATYNRGKPMNPRQLGKRLKEYSIVAKPIRLGGGVEKGFERAQFEDAWGRYIPLEHDASTTHETPENSGYIGYTVTSEQNQSLSRNQNLGCNQNLVTQNVTETANVTRIEECNRSTSILVTAKSLKSLTCNQNGKCNQNLTVSNSVHVDDEREENWGNFL